MDPQLQDERKTLIMDGNPRSAVFHDWGAGFDLNMPSRFYSDRAIDPITLPSLPTDQPPNSLPATLQTAMCRSLDPQSRSFLPRNELDQITSSRVREELRRSVPSLGHLELDFYTTQVGLDQTVPGCQDLGNAARFPCLLALLVKTDMFSEFIPAGFPYSCLPTHVNASSTKPSDSMVPSFCRNCAQSELDGFLKRQWIALSPFLCHSPQDVSLYDFDSKTIMPFICDARADASTRAGGHSQVVRVRIHPAHHNFACAAEDTPYFALKRLHSKRIHDFRREVTALQHCRASPHKHLIDLLSAFRHGSSFFLLFHWAEYDLAAFWEAMPGPNISRPNLLWATQQIHGIADALRWIHHPGKVAGTYGVHGDIKPSNILWFSSSANRLGTLVISDLGSVRLHTKDAMPHRGFTPTYRPPEFDQAGVVSRSYDIWSLGCVYLEFVTWLLFGFKGVHEFRRSRSQPRRPLALTGLPDVEDAFFEFAGTPSTPQPCLKPSVVQWIETLSESPRTSLHSLHLLDLIRHGLLQVDWAKRHTAGHVVDRLWEFNQKCLDDPEYMKVLRRPLKPPWTSEIHTIQHNNYQTTLHNQTSNLPVKMATFQSFSEPLDASASGSGPRRFRDLEMTNDWPGLEALEAPNIIPQHECTNTLYDMDALERSPVHEKGQNTASWKLVANQSSRRRQWENMTDPWQFEDAYPGKSYKRRREGSTTTIEAKPINHPKSQTLQTSNPKDLGLQQSAAAEKLYACPFYKQNPAKYSTKAWKACMGPGWNISRLKEHLDRKHCSSHYRCSRCLATFGTLAGLETHHRSDSQCQNNSHDQDVEEIDELQKAQIHQKHRGWSDRQKWDEIYRIIFKLEAYVTIPSPYNEPPRGGSGASPQEASSISLADFERHLRCRMANSNHPESALLGACLEEVQKFSQCKTAATEVPGSDVPALTCGSSDATTISSDAQPTTLPILGDGRQSLDDPAVVYDLDFVDPSFQTHFDDVFSTQKQDDFPSSYGFPDLASEEYIVLGAS
ncbi:kinase-like domain-containing protein [Xylariomycetidae sp. FL0641]|nr:kinase-like domain-containing protein [Xylariomycetidae sp. FL0641]